MVGVFESSDDFGMKSEWDNVPLLGETMGHFEISMGHT